jgi:hypothetical protein
MGDHPPPLDRRAAPHTRLDNMHKTGQHNIEIARVRFLLRLVFVSIVAVLTATASATSVKAAATSGRATASPPMALFNTGYNLCKAAPLAAIEKAAEQHYKSGAFFNGVCNWERSDLKAGTTLGTHPTAIGASLMKSFLAQNGKTGIEAERVRIPGASNAVLVTVPESSPQEISKYLFATYGPGTIQVNMTAPGVLPNARLIAVMRLIAHT